MEKKTILTPETEKDKTRRENLRQFQEAQDLAGKGLIRCRFCQKIKDLDSGLVTFKGGAMAFSLCRDCMDQGIGLIFRKVERGYELRFQVPKSGPIVIKSGPLITKP